MSAGGIFREGLKSREHPLDLGPQGIPGAVVKAQGTAEFRRRTLKYSWDLKKLKFERWHIFQKRSCK